MIPNRFVLIDAFALLFRAYYAIPATLTKDGRPVNAAYGFASALLSTIKNLEPEYLAVGMEYPKPTLRHKEYVEYKAHRPEAPADLVSQIPYIKELLRTMNIPTYLVEGYEGEDIVATIIKLTANSRRQTAKNEKAVSRQPSAVSQLEFIIVTGDMDLLQLIDEQTKVYSMARGINQAVMYDEAKVIERYGLTPAQFVDFKALKGDASDNIPGVKGIGEKGACKLIQEYGSLEKIYEVINPKSEARNPKQIQNSNDQNSKKDTKKPEISEKIFRLLLEQKEQAFLSRKLSKICADAPLEFNLQDARIHDYNREQVVKLFNSLGFKSLLSRLPEAHNGLEQTKLL